MAGYDRELSKIVAELNSAATPAAEAPQVAGSLEELLALAARRGASDLLLIAGAPATLRVGGALAPGSAEPLTGEDTRGLLLPLLTPAQAADLSRSRSVDFCFSREGIGRFRVNIHYQRGSLAGSIRLLPVQIPSLEALHLPAGLARLAERRQGLILVTGPTGCGKSTTLASLIDLINATRRDHIVTIEDPIEYAHTNRSSIVEQIEVGADTPDFVNSVRSVLRQTPDVILVGEMRDPETIATVLTAAETGHLVFSTLHTNDTVQAISRILDSFPQANQQQMRQQLSLALVAIIAQQLIPAASGTGRYPAVEILTGANAVRNLIRRGDDHQLYISLTTGRADGMISMEQSLAELVRSGRITRDEAIAHCFRPDDLRRYLED